MPFVMTDEFSVTKNYFKNWYLMNSQPFYLFIFNLFELDELSKACKPDNFESHNYLKLGFTNICETFFPILLIVNLSFNQTLLTFLLYVRQTEMTLLILTISL